MTAGRSSPAARERSASRRPPASRCPRRCCRSRRRRPLWPGHALPELRPPDPRRISSAKAESDRPG